MLLRHGRLAASYAAGAGLKSGCHGILLRKAAVTKEHAIVSQWARADKVGCRVALWWRRSWGSSSGRATGLWWRRSYGGRVGRAQPTAWRACKAIANEKRLDYCERRETGAARW